MSAFQASVAIVAAVVLQLILLYVPSLNAAFAALEAKIKFLIILGLDLLAALAVYAFFAFACPLIPGLPFACVPVGIPDLVGLVVVLLQSFLANVGLQQIVYQSLKVTENLPVAVTDAIAIRDKE